MLPAGTAEAFVDAPSWEARLPLDDLEPGAPPVPNPNPNPNPNPDPDPNPNPNLNQVIELLGPPTKEEEALIESEATVDFVRKVTPTPNLHPLPSP